MTKEQIEAWAMRVFEEALEAEDEEARHAANLCGQDPKTCSLCEVQDLAAQENLRGTPWE